MAELVEFRTGQRQDLYDENVYNESRYNENT